MKYSNWRAFSVHGQLDLVPLGKKGVETKNQFLVSLEKVRYTANNSRRVNLLRLKSLHNIKELIVDMRTVSELNLNLVEVEKSVLHSQLPHGWLVGWLVFFFLAIAAISCVSTILSC